MIRKFKIFLEEKYKKPAEIKVGDLLDGIDAPYKVIKVKPDYYVTVNSRGVEQTHEKKGGDVTLYEDKTRGSK